MPTHEPARNSDGEYFWYRQPGHIESHVPGEVFDQLQGGELSPRLPATRHYSTREEAIAALLAAQNANNSK